MISVNEAVVCIDRHCSVLPAAEIDLVDSLGYVLSDNIVAHDDIPSFNNSAMDGYAVRSEDITGAKQNNPVHLNVMGEIPAGRPSTIQLEHGTTLRIMTGGLVPEGADAVVRIEDTALPDDSSDSIKIHVSAAPGTNIRPAGEDIRRGETVLRQGNRINPAGMGILASLGAAKVPVIRKPLVAFLVTGDELIEPGEPLTPGKIRNSNTYSVFGLLEQYGAEVYNLGIGADSPETLRDALLRADDADMLITCGAVSVGKYDFLKEVLTSLGMERHFWSVAQKPGKPLLFGTLNGIPVFGLPGNPASVIISFYVYVSRALKKMMGFSSFVPEMAEAILNAPYKKPEGLTHYVRGACTINNGSLHVTPLTGQGSGMLKSMSSANCLIVLDEQTTSVGAGTSVSIIMLPQL